MNTRKKPAEKQQRAGAPRKVRDFVRARGARLVLIVGVLSAGIIGLCVAAVLWWSDSRPPSVSLPSPSRPEIRALQEEALGVASRLGEDFPDSPDPVVLMGNLQNSLGNSADALRCWQRCLKMDPQRADAYRDLGLIAMRKGQYEKALGLWRSALEIEPDMAYVRTFSARALMALGRPKEAVVALKKDIEISTRPSTSYFELGQAYRQLKEYEQAKQSYQKAIEIQPEYTNAYYGLAAVCTRLNQEGQSRKYMAEFKRLKTENRRFDKDQRSTYDDVALARRSVAQTHTDAGRVYYGHGMMRKAEEHWRRAAELDPDNVACRMQLVPTYMQDGRDREALRICEELARIEPDNAVTHLNIGVLNARLKRFDVALSAVERAIALDPDNGECQRARRLIQEQKRRHDSGG